MDEVEIVTPLETSKDNQNGPGQPEGMDMNGVSETDGESQEKSNPRITSVYDLEGEDGRRVGNKIKIKSHQIRKPNRIK